MSEAGQFFVKLFCRTCGVELARSLPATDGRRGATLEWPEGVDIRKLALGQVLC